MTERTPSTTSVGYYRYLTKAYSAITLAGIARALQWIFAIVIAGLYSVDLAHFTKIHAHAHAEWIYAEFVAAVSAITCIAFCSVTSNHVAWSLLDAVIFVLWLAQVGVFGSIYIPSVQPEYMGVTLSVGRMRAAVWISLINMVLWLLTALLRIVWCVNARKASRQKKSPKEYKALFLGKRRDAPTPSDQEYGYVDIEQEPPKYHDPKMSEKNGSEGRSFGKNFDQKC